MCKTSVHCTVKGVFAEVRTLSCQCVLLSKGKTEKGETGRKRSSHDVYNYYDTFARHSGLVYDITDTDVYNYYDTFARHSGLVYDITDTDVYNYYDTFATHSGLVYDIADTDVYNYYDTFATHSGLVYDVTDTACWAQNGTTHGVVFQA